MDPYPKSARSTWICGDLLPDIFKWLPVKSLYRFRCVSTSWNSLITSSLLINLQHSVTSSSTTPPHLKPYLRIPYFRVAPDFRCYDSYALYSPPDTACLNLNHLRHDVHFPFEFGEVTRLNFTHEDSCLRFTFVDIVRGVVCLSSTLDSTFDYTILWNPAIHKYLPLPRRTLPLHLETAIADFAHDPHFVGSVRFDCHALGFGYDTSKNDFKVVRLWIPRDDLFSSCNSLQPMYEVYSAREGLWRAAVAHITGPCIFNWATSRTGCFVNGTIHWLVTRYNFHNAFVLMFECEREEFTTVELPEEIRPPEGTSNQIELLEYSGMLCLLVGPRWVDHIDLWAMEKHGLANSWKKLFRIRTGECNILEPYQLSLDKLAPYGPAQWADIPCPEGTKFEQILSDRVYEESMFLMDDPKAQSYANDEIVCIQI